MDELIARLREESAALQKTAWSRMDGGQECSLSANLADEAATALEALRAENERLIAELSSERIRNGGIERLADRVRSLAVEVMDLERVSAAQAMEELAVAVDVLAPVSDRKALGDGHD